MKNWILALCLLAVTASSVPAAEEEFANKTIMVGMIVSDLEKSVAFYKEVVGMAQVDQERFSVDADFGKRSGLTDGLPINVEVLKLGSGEAATQLKLMTFGKKAKKQDNEYIHTHTGVQYITIFVKDLKPFIERIKKHKVKMLGETPIKLGEANGFILIKDPDGTFIELIGPWEKE